MKYYAVIDTNVLVSAMLKWESVPGHILRLVFEGTIIPVLNPDIVKEYQEVLKRPKFHLTEDIVEDIVGNMNLVGIYVDADNIEIELPDSKDKVFYEVVMEERKQEEAYLVTGNIKHFPKELYIVTPRQMLDIILNDVNE